MIFDHLMSSAADVLPVLNEYFSSEFWDWGPAFADSYWFSALRLGVRPYVVACFFTLCGIGCTFSRDNFGRSARILTVALAITLVTSVAERFVPGVFICFGVLHMLGCAVFVYAVIEAALNAVVRLARGRARRIAGMCARALPALIGVGLLFLYFSNWGELSVAGGVIEIFPTAETGSEWEWLLAALVQFRTDTFPSVDYFPMLPYGAFVLIGTAFGWAVYHTSARGAFSGLDGKWNAGLCFVGRHALWIYLLHQVAIVLALALCCWMDTLF